MEYSIDEIFKMNLDENHNSIIPINNIYKICKAVIKIELPNRAEASGFFILLTRKEKPFYCLMTNEHVISSNMIENKETIKIQYDNKEKNMQIILDREERIIISLMESLYIDVTIVEITPKEKINIGDSCFLNPSTDINSFEELIGKEIKIVHFPNGDKLSLSNGIIKGLIKEGEIKNNNNTEYLFYHDAPTQSGSSGSPIVIKGNNSVVAIHKSTVLNGHKNIGLFIQEVIKIIEAFQRDGKGKEYYENGKLKYEGNYRNDEYDGEGIFYYENGEFFEGNFIIGKKNGIGFLYKNGQAIKEIKYKEDQIIEEIDLIIENNNKANNEKDNENNKNISNNENDTVNNIFKIGSSIIKNIYDFKCTNCTHSIKIHKEISFGKWQCQECNEICKLFFL